MDIPLPYRIVGIALAGSISYIIYMDTNLANVSVPVPFDRLFTYIIPPEADRIAIPGTRVLVPFGKKFRIGYIVERPATSQHHTLKPITDVLDPEPILSEDILKLCKWISEYYMAPLGEVLRSATPQGLLGESKRVITLLKEPPLSLIEDWRKKSPRKAAIVHTLQHGGQFNITQLQKLTRFQNIYSAINELERDKYIRVADQLPRTSIKPRRERFISLEESSHHDTELIDEIASLQTRAPKQAAILSWLLEYKDVLPIIETELLKKTGAPKSSIQQLVSRGLISHETREITREEIEESHTPYPMELTSHQRDALEKICSYVTAHQHKTFLLNGITGSGKTQVYIDAIHHTLQEGKTAIVLVPEIALTPQIVGRFRGHFKDKIVVFHSRLSIGERYDAWQRARDGKASIAIGPRSAIFAPLKNLGLIIVDEEHESSYKQYDSSPRYNARDVSIMRSFLNGIPIILGSATPSIESYSNALAGKYVLLELPERINTKPLPAIHIINMREERKALREESNDGTMSISRLMRGHIQDRLMRKEGVIILQNRRGFSSYLECLDCGFLEECSKCSVTMTYHKVKLHLRCHYCGSVRSAPDICPKCNGTRLSFQGFGTQRVEEELGELFPKARIVRMDLDSTTRKGSHRKILSQFEEGKFEILLGTQMVAKGLDFNRVTLVGVISADTQLLLPDFRASERTFQLLTQVAGRSGRSELEGEVIIQTNHPDHYAILHAAKHDFISFYHEEVQRRTETLWPPLTRIALLEARSEKEGAALETLEGICSRLRLVLPADCILLGPAPAALAKIKNMFRYHLIIKAPRTFDPSGKVVRETIRKSLPGKISSGTKLIIDIDPYGIL
jgi:primosomal protein N' (replication factor Y) (superfamily II helicase)